ncbi:MAG: T9SS type A sorting domain-containing protein [Bacteroidota bacterium]
MTPLITYTRHLVWIAFFSFFFTHLHAQEVGTYYENASLGLEALTWMPDGNIFLVDYGGGKVHRLDPDKNLVTIATGLNSPVGGGVDGNGYFYFSEYSTNSIYKINSDDTYDLVAKGNGLNGPISLLLGEDSTFFYVTNYNDRKVMKLSLIDSSVVEFTGGNGINGPDAIIRAMNGDLIVANFNNNRLFRVELDGTVHNFGMHPSTGRMGYVVRAGNYYYVPSLDGHSIARLDSAGQATIWAGTGVAGFQNGPVATAQFRTPNGIAVSPSGDTLLVTEAQGKIRWITNLDGVQTSRDQGNVTPSILTYPQPFRDQLQLALHIPSVPTLDLEILSISGQSLDLMTISSKDAQSINWDLSHLPQGMYWVQVRHEDRILSTQKVMKE